LSLNAKRQFKTEYNIRAMKIALLTSFFIVTVIPIINHNAKNTAKIIFRY